MGGGSLINNFGSKYRWIICIIFLFLLVGGVNAISQYNSTDGLYTIVKFNGTGTTTWTPPVGVSQVDILIVGGGASAGMGQTGSYGPGGGGAGGLLSGNLIGVSGSYTVVVGSGGVGQGTQNTRGNNGTNSSFGSYIAYGGGGGSGGQSNPIGFSGGSGGGGDSVAGGAAGSATQTSQSPLVGYGSAGNRTASGGYGGGATGVVTGFTSSITGSSVTYATGGLSGTFLANVNGTNDEGDGGQGSWSGTSGSGGSGVVILKYLINPVASFTSNVTAGIAPFSVSFNDTSLNTPTGWAWFFGDEVWSPALWTQQNASSGWSARYGQTIVSLPDGSIVLTGGNAGPYYNDTWRSTNNGATWTLMNASSGWSARLGQTTVALSDGSIILMGGNDGSASPWKNDTWRSIDKGATWTRMNASSGWAGRQWHNSVALSDDSIVLLGGYNGPYYNDTWRSTDKGVTWTLMNASSGWTPRLAQTSVRMPDNSIVMTSGADNVIGVVNDTWRSTNNGVTWTRMNASSGWIGGHVGTGVAMFDGSVVFMNGYLNATTRFNETWRSTNNGETWTRINTSSGWSARWHMTAVAMSDGSIILISGYDGSASPYKNDTWRFNPITSTSQNTSHTYTTLGKYNVSLQAYNNIGSNSIRKAEYITSSIPSYTSTDGLYTIVKFNNSGSTTWTAPTGVNSVEYLIVAGGGGGGAFNWTGSLGGGGAGAGGMLNATNYPVIGGNTYIIDVGDGGVGGYNVYSTDGMNSSFDIIESKGGGRGGGILYIAAYEEYPPNNGGSGGGSIYNTSLGGSGISGQGYGGAYSYLTTQYGGGGGGGAGAIGANGTNSQRGGNGGNGRQNNITGTLTYYAGGGGGAVTHWGSTQGVGGLGGGGTGSEFGANYFGNGMTLNTSEHFDGVGDPVTKGTDGLGGGGGGGSDSTIGGDGGSGIVVIRYLTPVAPTAAFTSNTTGGIVPLSVQFNDTSINLSTGWAWFFGDEPYNQSWVQLTASSGWAGRWGFSTVVLQNGSMVVMGGYDYSNLYNDTWISTNNGTTWTQQNASSGWLKRNFPSSVVLPDNSIVLMGGTDGGGTYYNDTWRSTDKGATWVRQNASSGWSTGYGQSSVATVNGDIILMGGFTNETWKSIDKGVTWVRVNASSGWMPRYEFTSNVMPDNSIILLGGWDGSTRYGDVWRSTNNGTTWTQINASAGYGARYAHESVAMPDGSLVVMGGQGYGPVISDIWRSTNNGVTWTQLTSSPGWEARFYFGSVVLPNGSILILGGSAISGTKNDVWQFNPVGSSSQNPTHNYILTGKYNVSLQAYNSVGYNLTQKSEYISVYNQTIAQFTSDVTSGNAVLPVVFTDQSKNATGWSWFFGDESYTQAWVQQNASAGWGGREHPTSVVLLDGSIVLMGGIISGGTNDVWRSTDKGVTWVRQTASAAWSLRYRHTSVALPDGSIVLMGGSNGGASYNDTWRSTDKGVTWVQQNASSGWSARESSTSVVLFDGSILLIGGYDASYTLTNDVWKSIDKGVTWHQINSSAGWNARGDHTTVVLPDGKIVLMGGYGGGFTNFNDVWRSSDNGITWNQVNASAGWSVRNSQSSVALSDGSIVLMGGVGAGLTKYNDVWRSTDQGTMWTLINASAGWSARQDLCGNVMPDNSVVILNGFTGTKVDDVWRFQPSGSTSQNPVHAYMAAGNYSVVLQAYSSYMSNVTSGQYWINVSASPVAPIADFSGIPVAGNPPLSTVFTDLSVNATGWAWYFGDENMTPSIWTNINTTSGWLGSRSGMGMVNLPDGSFVIAGGEYGGYYNDTWRSVNNGTTWTLMNASSGWQSRTSMSMVSLSDGSIILIGGEKYAGGSIYYNDVWRSTDKGSTWSQINSSALSSGRYYMGTAVLPNDHIVLVAGFNGGWTTDVWKSSDKGLTWVLVNSTYGSPDIMAVGMASLPNGHLVFAGGQSHGSEQDNVWMSTDEGSTWKLQNNTPGFSARTDPMMVAIPDGSLLLTAGYGENDVWRSIDEGVLWTRINASAGYGSRYGSIAINPNGTILLGGGNSMWSSVTSSSNSQNPTHVFTRVGLHDVTLQAYNSGGYNLTSKNNYINVYGVMAAFSATPNPAPIGTSISFVDMSSNSPNSWNWSFGDGSYQNSTQNAAHVYLTIGEFTVTLTATNVYGDSASSSQNITIIPSTPIANFTIDHNIGANPLTVQFTDTSTGSGVIDWYWNFGDGTTSTTPSLVSHTYTSLGTYYPQLTVTSSVGTNVSQPQAIYVVNSAIPIADFAGAPISGSAPLSTQFTDLSVALSGVNAWNWSFGDGNYSNSQNPVHIYSASGQYSVTLTATSGAFSNYTSKSGYINIGVLANTVSVDFIANSTYAPTYPATIQFTDQSTCNPVCTNWVWDFNGDGAVDSLAQNPVYTYTYPGNYSPKLIVSNGLNTGTRIRNLYITIGPAFVRPTIPQPTAAWKPGYQYNGTLLVFKGNANIDLPNSTYLKYWLQNFSTTRNFSVSGFALGVMAPIMHVFGFWIFLIIWGLYLFAVWIRSQDVTMPLIIGILTMGTFGLLFPVEALPVIIIMFVICGGIIITKLMKDSI